MTCIMVFPWRWAISKVILTTINMISKYWIVFLRALIPHHLKKDTIESKKFVFHGKQYKGVMLKLVTP